MSMHGTGFAFCEGDMGQMKTYGTGFGLRAADQVILLTHGTGFAFCEHYLE